MDGAGANWNVDLTAELLVRLRDDLVFVPRSGRDSAQWIVKDPISCQNFLFSEQEFQLLQLFDGQRSNETIRKAWQERFCTSGLTSQQVREFGQRLVQDQLGVVDRAGLGRKYYDVHQKMAAKQRAAKWQSPIVMRLGGLDPTPVLELFGWLASLLFHRIFVTLTFLTTLLLTAYFVANAETIAQQMPTLSQFFSPKNAALMVVVLVIVKLFHELGHGLACRYYGGECLEIGVILLAFMPTLYCDVSDAWTFRERGKRIMVSFAGIYVELLLANLAAMIWLLTEPGLLNSTAFNVAVMCSFNTLFVNGNPLLKYDGYYMLSDWWEKPNLTHRARLAFRAFWHQAWRDVEPSSRSDRDYIWFGALSTLYRWFVLFSIVAGIYYVLNQCDIGRMSEIIVSGLILMMVVRMFFQSRMESRMIRGKFNGYRSAASIGALSLVGVLFFWMPLPSSIYCRFEVEPEEMGLVYAPDDGQLLTTGQPNQSVGANDVVATLVNESAQFELDQANENMGYLLDRKQRIERQIDTGLNLGPELQLVNSEIEKQRSELELLQDELDNHVIVAGRAGILKAVATQRNDQPEQMFQPLLQANRGCYVKRGQPLFSVIDGRRQVVAVVGERNVELLEVGQSVQLRFSQVKGPLKRGTITKIVETDLNLNAIQADRMGLEYTLDADGNRLLTETPYRVVIQLDAIPNHAMTGSAGYAKIKIPSLTASQKIGFLLDRWWNEL